MKQVCIIGLGQFGSEMARSLAKNCEVLALDRDEEKVNEYSDVVHRCLRLDSTDFQALSSVVTSDFDEAVVSMGESLEASVLATLHLKKIGIKRIWVKASSEDHATILQAIGATEIIFPERETARRVAAQIANPNLLDFLPLTEGYQVMDMAPPSVFYGHTLLELDLRKRFGVFVIAVREFVPPRFVFLPGPDFLVKPSDSLVMIGKLEDLERLQEAQEWEYIKKPVKGGKASQG